MELTHIHLAGTHRLIPSIYPPTGVLDLVASPADLETSIELEGWTDDRVSAELGVLRSIPHGEWVVGSPFATVIMAAFCHPHPRGGRFTDGSLGAWYAAFDLETAHREVIHHRTLELEEIGLLAGRVQVQDYLADLHAEFHDVRADIPSHARLHDPASYEDSQQLGADLRRAGSNGILYRSVRHRGGFCVACFKARLVSRVRPAGCYEYRWEGEREPLVTPLPSARLL
jgi:hypothetical protein